MSRKCTICGKGPQSGNSVSHSNRRTRRKFYANIQKIRYMSDGRQKNGYVCSRCIKTNRLHKLV